MATGLLELIKRASLDAIDSVQMSDLRFGTVVSTSPLKVQITNLFTIPESMLIVPQHLTDYEVDVTPQSGWDVETTTIKKLKIHSGLKVGDKVSMVRKQGGQSYCIIDRISG